MGRGLEGSLSDAAERNMKQYYAKHGPTKEQTLAAIARLEAQRTAEMEAQVEAPKVAPTQDDVRARISVLADQNLTGAQADAALAEMEA